MKKRILLTAPFFLWGLMQPLTVLAVTEAEVEAVGKETAAGNVFIWFLCAIAFLKISQKIDSFLSSLGINVGNTGGSMLEEVMIAVGLSAQAEVPTASTAPPSSPAGLPVPSAGSFPKAP